MSEANKAVVRRWVEEGLNKGHVNLLDELVGDDYVWHGPGGKELIGLTALKEFVAAYLRAFPDLRMTIDDQIAEGDRVVTRWTAHGTHKGPLEGIAATGKTVTLTGIAVDRFAGGKWVEEWESFDELGMMQQIGALPAASGV